MASCTTPATQPLRNKHGDLLCEHCEDGKVEVVYGRFADGSESTGLEDCDACDGRGVRVCADCAAPAKIVGENGLQVYCGVECATKDENWPACVVCEAKPQDVTDAPFCGAACSIRFKARVVRELRTGSERG